MYLSSSDERTIRKIREGVSNIYPESRVEWCFLPGCLLSLLPALFLLLEFDEPSLHEPYWVEEASSVMLFGLCLLGLATVVWLGFRRKYYYLGFRRSAIAQGITAVDLLNHGHSPDVTILDPIHPAEYGMGFVSMFAALGLGRLLHRMGLIEWEVDALREIPRYTTKYSCTLILFVVGFGVAWLSLVVRLRMFLTAAAFLIGILMIMLGLLLVFSRLSRERRIRQAYSGMRVDLSDLLGVELGRVGRVEDMIAQIRSSYSHPIRVLVTDTYDGLEYTGRTYLNIDSVELREAILIPH